MLKVFIINFQIPNAPKITRLPIIYGNSASLTLALSFALDTINMIPKINPTITDIIMPIDESIL